MRKKFIEILYNIINLKCVHTNLYLILIIKFVYSRKKNKGRSETVCYNVNAEKFLSQSDVILDVICMIEYFIKEIFKNSNCIHARE